MSAKSFLNTWGIALLFLSLYLAYTLHNFYVYTGNKDFFAFVCVMIAIHIAVASMLLFRVRFGIRLLKIYLYFLLLGFPIGTYIAYNSLKYIKKNNMLARPSYE